MSEYIFNIENIEESGLEIQIPDAATSCVPVAVDGVEFVPDAYEAILDAEKKGLLSIQRYDEKSSKMKEWIVKTIQEEFDSSADHPEYRHFLKGNFPDIIDNKE